MFGFPYLLMLFPIITSVVVVATPLATMPERVVERFNPLMHGYQNTAWSTDLSQHEANRLTNGQRLARGLPLKLPVRRPLTESNSSTIHNVTTKGYLAISENKHVLGCISNKYNEFGEYGVLTNHPADCLLVSFEVESKRHASMISTINGPLAAYPYFGAISGYNCTTSDLGVGRSDYAVLGGTVRRPANSLPMEGGNSFTHLAGISRTIENAIFSYNLSTGEIGTHWVNGDGQTPAVYLGHNSAEAALFIAGDKSL